MKNANQHTPTPWEVSKTEPLYSDNAIEIVGLNRNDDMEVIAGMRLEGPIHEANAAFIVRAVNAHNDLLMIAKDALCELDPDCKYDGAEWVEGMTDRESLVIGLYEAIAKAEGK